MPNMFHHVGNMALVSQLFKSSISQQNVTKINLQSIRGFRRPYELGETKSRLYKIKKPPTENLEEAPDMKRLYANYNLQMLSLRQHFFELKKELDIAKPEDTFEDDFIKLSKRVDEWNRKVADVRVAREDEKRTAEEIRILEDIDCRQKKQEEERLRVNELVRLEKEAAKSFIVRENVDEAIEMALNNKVDYNFAIDAEGQQYAGRFDPKLSQTSKKQRLNQHEC